MFKDGAGICPGTSCVFDVTRSIAWMDQLGEAKGL